MKSDDKFPAPPMILDGALATELERRGFNLDDPLWSAKLLFERPETIRQLHLDYYLAGADCTIAATYQATIQGFIARGLDRRQAREMIRQAVDLDCQARDLAGRQLNSSRPLYAAASVGPYGAYLHDGSEYRGAYGKSLRFLAEFHAERFELLAESGADWLACETIPSLLEAEALLSVLERFPERKAWFSFTAADETRIAEGEPISKCARLLGGHPQVLAVGVNCTHPRFVSGLIAAIRDCTVTPVVVYPNSGETWEPMSRRWTGDADAKAFADWAAQWTREGAAYVGGCCRTGPEHIRALSQVLR